MLTKNLKSTYLSFVNNVVNFFCDRSTFGLKGSLFNCLSAKSNSFQCIAINENTPHLTLTHYIEMSYTSLF